MLQSCGEFQLQPPEKAAEVASVDISDSRLALLWSNGLLQCFSHQAASANQISLRLLFQRKLSGFPGGDHEKVRQATASPKTPKKRGAVMPAQQSAQHAEHGSPSVRLCSSSLLAVAACVHPGDSASQAGPDEALAVSSVMQTSTASGLSHKSLNGPVRTPGVVLKGAGWTPCLSLQQKTCMSDFIGMYWAPLCTHAMLCPEIEAHQAIGPWVTCCAVPIHIPK